MAEKKITTETLARMVQNEFVVVNDRLVKLEIGIQEVREEIKGLRSEMKAGFEMLNKTLEKRKFIQTKIRKASDKDINKYIKMSPRWSYYYYNLFRTIQEYND